MLHHAAVQGAQGHAACGWHERAKREWVLGRSAENLYRWVWAGRTACVAGRPLETMHQPMGGWAMRGHFKSAQISRGCFAATRDVHQRKLHRLRTASLQTFRLRT